MRIGGRGFHLVVMVAVVALGIAGVAIAVGSGWTTNTGEKLPPDLTKSGQCTGEGAIFCDGFEGGSMTGWTPRACDVPAVNLPTP